MFKQKLLKHLVDELNTMELVAVPNNSCSSLISIMFKNKNLSYQNRGVMEVFQYLDTKDGYVRWCGHKKQLTKFEITLLMGIVSANHHRIYFEN